MGLSLHTGIATNEIYLLGGLSLVGFICIGPLIPYRGTTLLAHGPFCPWPTSNSTG